MGKKSATYPLQMIPLYFVAPKHSLQFNLKTMSQYEKVLGQLINKNKSCFTMAPGCPRRKRLNFYTNMVTKVINIIIGWYLKFLSFGGRVILIRHVLRALNIHTLVVFHPPKGTISMIKRYICRFFWSGLEEGGKHHWIS